MKNKNMSKFKNTTFIFAVLLVLGLIKIFFLTNKKPETAAGQMPKRWPPNVTGYIVKAEVLDNNVLLPGTISANEEVTLNPEGVGEIITLHIVEGGKVMKVLLLLKINDADLQAQLKNFSYSYALPKERRTPEKIAGYKRRQQRRI